MTIYEALKKGQQKVRVIIAKLETGPLNREFIRVLKNELFPHVQGEEKTFNSPLRDKLNRQGFIVDMGVSADIVVKRLID